MHKSINFLFLRYRSITFEMLSIQQSHFSTTFFSSKSKKICKKNNDYSFCWKSNHWKKDCNELQILIKNEHVYVNNVSFFKICQNKSKNAEFSLRFSKDVNQLNEILFIFELNANVYFSIRANALSITTKIFENAANYIYDSEKKISIFSNKSFKLREEKKNCVKIDKKKFFES